MKSAARALATRAKSLVMFSLLTLPVAASAGEVSVGAAGGAMVTDPLEVIGSGWYVTPRVGYFFDDNLGLELDVGFQGGKTRIGEHPYTAITPRVNLIGKLWNQGRRQEDGSFGNPPPIHPTLAVGLGAWYKNTNDGVDEPLGSDYIRKDLDFLANAGPGLMVPLGPAHLRTDLRWVISLGNENFQNRGDQFVSWEWTAGIGFTFGGERDRDGDGIIDAEDQCVDDAEDMDEFEDEDGCPEDDNDKDGVLDADDDCDNEPEDDDDFEDNDGCPDEDNDEDGVLDADDTCPDEAGNESAKGCPDEDEDSLADADDECPSEAGEVASFGCPDDDEDHVPNYRDMCPIVPGPMAADGRRSDGCPHKVFITATAIKITDKIFFDTGKATIKKESNALLEEIAETLTKYEGIKKVSIEGHTDNTGDPEANQTLSEARATSVRTWLVETGEIDEGRLDSKGFGQEKPLVDGEEADTDEGRAQNRRVEFVITEQEEMESPLKRPKVELADPSSEDALDVKGLVAKTNPMPKSGFVKQNVECKAKTLIDAEGKVTKVKIDECVGLARLATEKTLMAWEFEPYEVDGKATAVSTVFNVKFTDGEATVKHAAKNLKPQED